MSQRQIDDAPGGRAWLTVVATSLAGMWLAPYALHGFTMPLGPDVPVYVWWARLAQAQGIGAAGHRPGSTAALVVLSESLHLSLLPLIGGLLVVVAVSLALAGGMLLRAAGLDRPTWVLGSLLVGLYARYLLWGYLANLMFALLFVGAVTVAIRSGRRTTLPATAMFAAAGLAHPYFFVVGAAIVALAAVGERLRDRRGGTTPAPLASALMCVVCGGVVAAAGVASTFVGPQYAFSLAPDAVLRDAGFGGILRDGYRAQMRAVVRTDGIWLIPEAGFAVVARLHDPVGRFLGSWGFLTVLGLPAALAWPAFAAQRLAFFGFFLPALAAVGVASVAARSRPAFGRALVVLVLGLAAFGAARWWWGITPFFTAPQLDQATTAGRVVAATPAGTPVVVVVDEEGQETVLAIRAVNALRTAVPPDRIPDVFGYFGPVTDVLDGRPSALDEPLRTLQTITLADVHAVGVRPVVLVLAAFNDDPTAGGGLAAVGPGVRASARASSAALQDTPRPTSPAAIVGAAALVAAALFLAGSGWARATLDRDLASWALAPAFGLAGVVLAGTAVDAVGVRIGPAAAAVIMLVVAAGGWLVALRRGAALSGR